MQLALVTGSVTATLKHPSFEGWKLLIVQALDARRRPTDGDPLVAVDLVGAGEGDTVMLSSDGPTARNAMQCDLAPVRWSIIGIQDR